MTYQTTITSKGQITIPKEVRDALHLEKNKKLIVEVEQAGKAIRIRPTEDFIALAKQTNVKKVDPLKARTYMEQEYERT